MFILLFDVWFVNNLTVKNAINTDQTTTLVALICSYAHLDHT